MTLEFAQTNHDAISAAFADKLEAINTAAAFVPSPLQVRVMKEFVGGHHRLTYLTSYKEGRMSLRNSVAAAVLDTLVDMGYMGFYPSAQKYALVKKGRDYLDGFDLPPVTGIKTPPRTYGNATPTDQSYSVPKLNLRDGWDEHFRRQSLPMRSQIQRVGV